MPKATKTGKKLVKKVVQAASLRRMYELTVVLSPMVKAEKRAEAVETIKTMIEKLSGNVQKTEEWGLKDLAYPIKHQRSGWYILLTAELSSDTVSGVDQAVLRDKNVLRHLVVSL